MQTACKGFLDLDCLWSKVGGDLGAGAIAARLRARGVRLQLVLDEGGIILADGLAPFTSTPIAVCATAEKAGALALLSIAPIIAPHLY